LIALYSEVYRYRCPEVYPKIQDPNRSVEYTAQNRETHSGFFAAIFNSFLVPFMEQKTARIHPSISEIIHIPYGGRTIFIRQITIAKRQNVNKI